MKRKDHVPLSLKVSQRFGYPRVFYASGIPSGDTQNTDSKLNKRLGQVHLMLKIRIYLREKVNNCLKLHSLATKKTDHLRVNQIQ